MTTMVITAVMALAMAVMMISVGTVVMGESSGGGDEGATGNFGDGGECSGSSDDCVDGFERGDGASSLTPYY